MKKITAFLATALVTTTPLPADGLVLRYHEIPDTVSITMSHDIRVAESNVQAARNLAVELAVESDSDSITATVGSLRATYSAHEMTQRLSNGHLVGRRFGLTITADGRSVDATPGGPAVELGGLQADELDLASAVSGWLPELPPEPVGAGSSWTTERTSLSLEGWAWASASVVSRHTVLAVDVADGHSIVTVESKGSGRLVAAGGDTDSEAVGELVLTARWRFDATAGRLLSLTLDQRSEGVNVLPKGRISIRQNTEIELAER